MASVELSAGIMSGLPARIIYPTASTNNIISTLSNTIALYNVYPLIPYSWYVTSTNFARIVTGLINIYQGIVPTDFSTLTAYNSRSADLLISYSSNNQEQLYYTLNVSTNPAVINTGYNTATASGTATWFRWYTYGGSDTGFAINQQIIGTVGATGSGADLEIPSTSIVVNRAYRIQNLRIQFPSSWSY